MAWGSELGRVELVMYVQAHGVSGRCVVFVGSCLNCASPSQLLKRGVLGNTMEEALRILLGSNMYIPTRRLYEYRCGMVDGRGRH